ncbi:HD domain-containing protein [Streptomyces sp. NPDC059590]|uniref:HD domain-containing protein n=1 Tax=Streptomyces sp. NPDC059590 TaxID=3346877 RepID=UPI0036A0B8DC
MTDPYAGLPFPRTALALKALHHTRGIEAPAIFNHSLRTYLYGRFLGECRGLRPDHDYDDELLFLGCLLHDAGLSREGDRDQTFNLDGADLAARFLTGQGMAADRVDIVWDDTIVDQALAKPHKAPVFTMPGELLRQKTGTPWPTWQQLMAQEPSWHD